MAGKVFKSSKLLPAEKTMTKITVKTDAGEFAAYYSEQGLARLEFPGGEKQASPAGEKSSALVSEWHAATAKALNEVLAGRKPGILPPLDLSSGTDFQQRVWKVLL